MKVREWYLAYVPREHRRWWAKHLHPDFRHVELERRVSYGPRPTDVMWLQLLPTYETLDVGLCMDPRPPWERCPEATIQKVTAMRALDTVRSWCDFGPQTCVEVAKMALGIRAFWVRTPYQLFNYIQRRGGVITSR